MNLRSQYVWILLVTALAVSIWCVNAAASESGAHDFDFLYGTWTVHNVRLEKMPAGDQRWLTFDSTDKCWPLPGGLGNEDVYRRAPGFVGFTLRLFNPTTGTWKIYWIDNKSSHGDAGAPNVGRFHGNVGIFDEPLMDGGRPAIDRYTWTKFSNGNKDAAHFEESLSRDGGKTWKVFYRADLTRTS